MLQSRAPQPWSSGTPALTWKIPNHFPFFSFIWDGSLQILIGWTHVILEKQVRETWIMSRPREAQRHSSASENRTKDANVQQGDTAAGETSGTKVQKSNVRLTHVWAWAASRHEHNREKWPFTCAAARSSISSTAQFVVKNTSVFVRSEQVRRPQRAPGGCAVTRGRAWFVWRSALAGWCFALDKLGMIEAINQKTKITKWM